MKKYKEVLIAIVVALVIIGVVLVVTPLFVKDDRGENNSEPEKQEEVIEVSKFNIFNTLSKNRPYAVVVNNTPVAVKVQEGLNEAYIVYEFPTEGYTSRLMALYQDISSLKIGTIRSARHNFIDYANESDAILVCFGWSHYAQDELNGGSIDFLNGNESKWSSAFWRDNPEKLAREHTAYTDLSKVIDYAKNNNYRLESDNTLLLNYSASEINLDNKEGVQTANSITLPYGNITTVFKYDENSKEYIKYVNSKEIKDHNTKESITTKNIIVVKVSHKMTSDNYYWDLSTTGSGDGYYITNGKSVPIKWSKETRNSKSKYTYLDGSEIDVNDGRTYIEIHSTRKSVTIE